MLLLHDGAGCSLYSTGECGASECGASTLLPNFVKSFDSTFDKAFGNSQTARLILYCLHPLHAVASNPPAVVRSPTADLPTAAAAAAHIAAAAAPVLGLAKRRRRTGANLPQQQRRDTSPRAKAGACLGESVASGCGDGGWQEEGSGLQANRRLSLAESGEDCSSDCLDWAGNGICNHMDWGYDCWNPGCEWDGGDCDPGASVLTNTTLTGASQDARQFVHTIRYGNLLLLGTPVPSCHPWRVCTQYLCGNLSNGIVVIPHCGL